MASTPATIETALPLEELLRLPEVGLAGFPRLESLALRDPKNPPSGKPSEIQERLGCERSSARNTNSRFPSSVVFIVP